MSAASKACQQLGESGRSNRQVVRHVKALITPVGKAVVKAVVKAEG
jgi:hypothetical protein